MSITKGSGGVAPEPADDVELIARVGSLDIGKAELVACVRTPDADHPGRRATEIRTFSTMPGRLLELADWLRAAQVQRVSMESTSSYWEPVYFLLEAEGLPLWLFNARHVKHLPGRPKTDKLDAVWLAKVTERGMCMPSLVQPAPIRALRELTRYRRSVVRDRSCEQQRLEKLLESTGIKLSVVVSDVCGASGRAILEAILAGERNPRVLAEMARGRLRTKIGMLREALVVTTFNTEHAVLLRAMLDRIDAADHTVAHLDEAITAALAPFRRQHAQLDTIIGVGPTGAAELIAEIGVDMTKFPTAGHLASWAKFAPIERASAGRAKPAHAGKRNPWLGATIGEIVAVAAKSHTFLGARYRRLAKHRGTNRAIVATGHSLLVIIWNMLQDPDAVFRDLGENHYQQRHANPRRQRDLIRDLERLTGAKVTLTPAA